MQLTNAPLLLNSNGTTPSTSVYSILTFTCNYGYASSGGAMGPYITCLPDIPLSGKWTSITYSCQRMTITMNSNNNIKFHLLILLLLVHLINLVILFYCETDPSVNSPATVVPSQIIPQTIGRVITLQCPSGNTLALNSGDLNVQCVASTPSQGVWTSASGYCIRMF